MFENITFDLIMSRMLNRISDDMDKREGSIIYDALAPAAVELQLAYLEMDNMLNEVFADTASREYLIRRAKERGLTPKEATQAILKAEFTPADVKVLNQRFSCGELNYVVTELISNGLYKVKCESAGVVGNSNFGIMTPIEYISELETAKLIEVLIPGEDEEATEVFRQRYMSSLQSDAFGGNIQDYKEKLHGLAGVGGVKVYRAEEWNGAGTVKLVIQDSNFKVPATDLITGLQELIDPNNGSGEGIAPIGHQVAVIGVESGDVEVKGKLILSDDIQYEDIQEEVVATVRSYFDELNSQWEDVEQIIIYPAQIISRLMNIKGIVNVDTSTLTINGSAGNVYLNKNGIIDMDSEDTTFTLIEE